MDISGIPLFAMLRQRLGYEGERQRVIAQNVANADTPGYVGRDLKAFTFSAQVESQTGLAMLQPTQTASAAWHVAGRRLAWLDHGHARLALDLGGEGERFQVTADKTGRVGIGHVLRDHPLPLAQIAQALAQHGEQRNAGNVHQRRW